MDTSALYALLDRSDANHRRAEEALLRLKEERAQVFLSNYIRAETHALLLSRLGPSLAREWLLSNRWPVERASERDEERAVEIIAKCGDKGFSYVDCISFAVMERLRVRRAFTFDAHFQQFGWLMVP